MYFTVNASTKKVMNITKNIENIIGNLLEEQGFKYEKHTRSWIYSRNKGEIIQHIDLLGHRYFKGKIKAVFYTNAYGQGVHEFAEFIPDIGTYHEFWAYKNEDELRQILEQFKEWIIKYGLTFLEEISKPTTEARPKPETSLYLYQNHKEIYKRYQKEWQLTDGKETIHILKEKMETLFDKDFSEIEQTLIEYAAVYGHAMCIGGEGEWVWEKITNTCVLVHPGGIGECDPLKDVISSYESRSDILESRYDNQILYRNRLLELKAKKAKAKGK